ncbi:MAG: inositol-3-phosphate synthase [Planctomycetes bacterium]|nr:inositol-3-phosphate synthase [Planctomycetota bacterium]MCC7170665.1 inositol-3-phosphate synthase [Planctomycetota bacterium]
MTRTGIWIVGARGGVATTTVVGALAIARGLCPPTGCVSTLPPFAKLPLPEFPELVFGGHDLEVPMSFADDALELARVGRFLDPALIETLRGELDAFGARVRRGIATNCGPAVRQAQTNVAGDTSTPLRDQLAGLERDLRSFRTQHALDDIVVVNLASTEPPLAADAAQATSAALFDAIDRDSVSTVRASSLYAIAALRTGCAFVNFTPSNAAMLPGIVDLAQAEGLPIAGSDGKTGETLVKAALAPMFAHRNLRVLSWQGYNMLGDRDGEVLADPEHRRSKVHSKDGVVSGILGYPLHTHVGIDFVPSLHDHKTAFDLVHFEGFLGHRMMLTFTWLGCDSILAAPLVLDLVRFMVAAKRRGERGVQRQLACFFKSPAGVTEHDFHKQFESLLEYATRA